MKLKLKQIGETTAGAGQKLIYSGGWIPYSNFKYDENETESTTSSATFQEAFTLETPEIPEGEYEIGVQCSVRCDSSTWATILRIQLDDTTDLLPETFFTEKDPSPNQRRAFDFAQVIHLSSGTHDIDIDFRAESTVRPAYIYSKRIFIRDAPITINTGSASTHNNMLRWKQIEQSGAEDNQQLVWDGSNYVPFGYFQTIEDIGEDTTTSSTFQEKLKLTTSSSMPYGTYLVYWHWTWRRVSTSGDAGFRVQFDNITDLQTWEKENKDRSTNQRNVISGFRILENISGSHDIDIDYRNVTSVKTVGIQNAWMSIEQVDISI